MQWSRGHVVWSSNGISSLHIDSDCSWQHGQVALILHIDLKRAEARAGCSEESNNRLEHEAALKDSRFEIGVGTKSVTNCSHQLVQMGNEDNNLLQDKLFHLQDKNMTRNKLAFPLLTVR